MQLDDTDHVDDVRLHQLFRIKDKLLVSRVRNIPAVSDFEAPQTKEMGEATGNLEGFPGLTMSIGSTCGALLLVLTGLIGLTVCRTPP